jgi:hypothetical protein
MKKFAVLFLFLASIAGGQTKINLETQAKGVLPSANMTPCGAEGPSHSAGIMPDPGSTVVGGTRVVEADCAWHSLAFSDLGGPAPWQADDPFQVWNGLEIMGNSGSPSYSLRLDGATSGYVGFLAPAVSPSVVWTLPTADSSGTQCLSSDGSGNLGWSACSGGAGGVTLQGSSPGTPDTGNFNISGDGIIGGNLGVGMTPTSAMSVYTTGAIPLDFVIDGASTPTLRIFGYRTGLAGPLFSVGSARGTYASPTADAINDRLGMFTFSGYDGSAFRVVAGIEADAGSSGSSGPLSSTNFPSVIHITTTPNGSATRGAAMDIDSANTTLYNNLTFDSTGKRIYADLSNATISSRMFFQPSTADSSGNVNIMPSGTGVASGFLAFGKSDPDNSSYAAFSMNESAGALNFTTGHSGSGTTRPVRFLIDSTEAMRLDTSSRFHIGGASSGTKLLNVGSSDQFGVDTSGNLTTSGDVLGATIHGGGASQFVVASTGAVTDSASITSSASGNGIIANNNVKGTTVTCGRDLTSGYTLDCATSNSTSYFSFTTTASQSTSNTVSLLLKGNTTTSERVMGQILSAYTGTTDATRTSKIGFYTQNAGSQVEVLELNGHDVHLYGHVKDATSTPGIAAGTGAGTSPSVSVTGGDVAGMISVTTGSGSPAASATIATITFASAYAAAPRAVLLTPANANANGLYANASNSQHVYVDSANTTTAHFIVTSGTIALPTATAFQWYYQVIQ